MELTPPPDHATFAAGIRQQTTKCHFVDEPFQFLSTAQKKKFAVFVILYLVTPLIFVPIWAYYQRSWWLLLGIAASLFGVFLGSRASSQDVRATSGGFLPFLLIGLWYFEGFGSRDMFYALSATWGWAWYFMADEAQQNWA